MSDMTEHESCSDCEHNPGAYPWCDKDYAICLHQDQGTPERGRCNFYYNLYKPKE